MDVKTPLLSIVIPVYNSEKDLPKCLDSIFAETYKNIELIVVNNGSKGNVNEIIDDYHLAYPEYIIKMVKHEENQGLFLARVSGVEIASGDYITFMDSDDAVSVDFHYKLIQNACKTGADVVMADYLHDFEEGGLQYYNFNPVAMSDMELYGEDCLKTFFESEGGCFTWHAVWTKIYKKDLWDRVYEDIKQITDKFVLSEDIVFSTILLSKAKKLTNIHGVHYYHAVSKQAASSNMGASYDKMMRSLNDQLIAYSIIENYLKKYGLYEKHKINYEAYKGYILKVVMANIKMGSFHPIQKKQLCDYCKRVFKVDKIEYPSEKERFFESCLSPYNDGIERIKKEILRDDIEYVSFDIFDTLIMRPFWEPTDLFKLLNKEFDSLHSGGNFVDFSKIRKEAESAARKKCMVEHSSYEEVNLKEIYEEISETYDIPQNLCNRLMEKELELELEFCTVRKAGWELYDFALRNGKKIIYISDMYLPQDIIQKLLKKNGYENISKVYISSEFRLCKYNGKLFRAVLNDLKIENCSAIVHIGDNYYSDYCAPSSMGIRTVHFVKSVDLFQNLNQSIYTGESFRNIYNFGNNNAALGYMGIRCMLGLVANRIFDNPFTQFNFSSDFNANPKYIGYYPLGMYIYTLANWLIRQVTGKEYKTIHFISRDGYLVKQAYEIIKASSHVALPEANYLYVSRKSMMGLMVSCKKDLLTLGNFINIFAYSPEKLLNDLKDIIQAEKLSIAEQICAEHKILYHKNFSTQYEWDQFMSVYEDNFYCEAAIVEYRQKMRTYFVGIIDGHDCTFDAGYSGRTEALLSGLLDIKLDAFYIYCNEERALYCARQFGFKITAFEKNSASVSQMMLLETFISDSGPSCVGYKMFGDQVRPIWGKIEFNYQTMFIIEAMQNAALDFVKDMQKTYGAYMDLLYFRNEDAALPFHYLLEQAKNFDMKIFSVAMWSDELCFDKEISLYDYWGRLVYERKALDNHNPYFDYDHLTRWKKLAVLILFDRKTLKDKVKIKFADHPVVLKVMKICYSIPRGIKRAMFK